MATRGRLPGAIRPKREPPAPAAIAWATVTDPPPTPEAIYVVGVGTALVDVLSHEDEDFVAAHELVKGAMTLIETERAEELYASKGECLEMSGGSAANTISGIASFGGTAAYIEIGRAHV